MTEVKRLLILGSGFSKAVFSGMPTVRELAQRLQQEEALKKKPYDKLVGDPELLLSYLSMEHPWKEPPEVLEDEALFSRIQRILGEFILDCEDKSFRTPIPKWAIQLAEQLHSHKIPVITFNYDTILERVATHSFQQNDKEADAYSLTYSFYRLPLSSIIARRAGVFGPEEIETFQLIKLHGSVNWYYSGVDVFPGEQVYLYVPTKSNVPPQRINLLLKDKTPLIIPPVSEKSHFYSNQTLRSLWRDARNAMANADEIFCVGYSLPQTDLTTKLLFRSVAHPKKVVIVNESAPELLERYQEAFPEAKIEAGFKGENAVKEMVDYLARGS